jgi:hypothetical protein
MQQEFRCASHFPQEPAICGAKCIHNLLRMLSTSIAATWCCTIWQAGTDQCATQRHAQANTHPTRLPCLHACGSTRNDTYANTPYAPGSYKDLLAVALAANLLRMLNSSSDATCAAHCAQEAAILLRMIRKQTTHTYRMRDKLESYVADLLAIALATNLLRMLNSIRDTTPRCTQHSSSAVPPGPNPSSCGRV